MVFENPWEHWYLMPPPICKNKRIGHSSLPPIHCQPLHNAKRLRNFPACVFYQSQAFTQNITTQKVLL